MRDQEFEKISAMLLSLYNIDMFIYLKDKNNLVILFMKIPLYKIIEGRNLN